MAGKRPVVIAHRGASAYLPEHTLVGKALAHAQGADFLEQDIVASRDGVPLVFHDLILDALTDAAEQYPGRCRPDGHFYCIDFDLAELRTLRVRERIDIATGQPRYGRRFPRDAGAFPIPTLAEELSFIRGLNRSTGREAGIYPEIKAPAWHQEQGIDLTAAVIDELDCAGYLRPGQPVFLQCFEAPALQAVHARCGDQLQLIQLLADEADTSPATMQAIAAYARGIGPSLRLLAHYTRGQWQATGAVDRAHAAGLLVHPYTLRADDLPTGCASLDELLGLCVHQLDVDGFFTDFPDRARSWLNRSLPV